MQFIRVFATLLAFAATSALASPIPAGSVAKKEVGTFEYDLLVREPEALDSGLDILAREPEIVEAREPICTDRGCV